jgi:hypothetical protein
MVQAPMVEPSTSLTLSDTVTEAIEEMYQLGWTDGLPVVPPEKGLVGRFLEAAGLDGSHQMPPVPPLMRSTTLEQWAANIVMAGALPAYVPAVLAAMTAVLEPDAGLFSSQTATNPSTPVLFYNGPVINALDMNGGGNCMGPDNRANLTIGRAVRLILRNIGGEKPGLNDPSTHGQAGKISFCFAENEDESPWEPWHVAQGLQATDSTVTALMGNAPQSIFAYGCTNAEELLGYLLANFSARGHMNVLFDPGPLLVLSPEHAHILAREGYSRSSLQQTLFDRSRIEIAALPEPAIKALRTRRVRWFELHGDTPYVGIADRPEDIYVIVAGGAGIHSVFVSTSFCHRPVTKTFDLAGAVPKLPI